MIDEEQHQENLMIQETLEKDKFVESNITSSLV